MDRQNKNLCIRIELYDLPRRIKPIQQRHADVQNSHVRFQLVSLGSSKPSIFHFCNNLPRWLLLDKCAESSSNNVMIICNQYACCTHVYILAVFFQGTDWIEATGGILR